MLKFYYKCAALLVAVGMVLASTTALAQSPEEASSASGLSLMDSGTEPIPEVYFWPDDDVSYTTTRSQWALAEMPAPREQELFRMGNLGDFGDMKPFGIKWNEQEYISGIATGAASFSITGEYFPLDADQALWDQGLLLIDAETVPKMEIHVTRTASLPFTVELGYDVWAEGHYPVFSYPMPHGASEVLFEASNDGTTWISETQKYNSEGFADKRNVYSMQWLMSEEGGHFSAHRASYYRVTVRGSAYDVNGGADGSVSTFILNGLPVGVKPPDSALDDSGGNRGGVGQEETDRVLLPKGESAPNTAASPSGGLAGLASSEVAQIPADVAASDEAPNQTSGGTTDKTTDKTAGGTPNKTSSEAADKTSSEAADKTSSEAADKTSSEAADKASSETSGEMTDKTSDIPLDEAPTHKAIEAMSETGAAPADDRGSPAIPGAVTAAVCTGVAISAASVLLKFNWQAILKLIQRKP